MMLVEKFNCEIIFKGETEEADTSIPGIFKSRTKLYDSMPEIAGHRRAGVHIYTWCCSRSLLLNGLPLFGR